MRALAPRRLLAAEDGASAAEFAIVVPIFLTLLLGAFDFGHALWTINSLQFVVEQGARYTMLPEINGVSRPTSDDCSSTAASFAAQVQNLMQTDLDNALLSAATPSVVAGSCPSGGLPTLTYTISASYPFSFWLKVLLPYGPSNLQQGETVTTPLT